MKSIGIVLLFFMVSGMYGLHAQRPEIALSQKEFDSFDCCWRKLNAEKRYAESAALLVEYIEHSPHTANKHSLNWHAGQMYAAAGDVDKALRYFRKTFSIFHKWFGDREWYYFAKANVAFVKRDKAKLERIISKWEKALPKDGIYIGLLKLWENWDKSYNEAFE